MDRRQQKTRAAIFEALNRLLADKNYAKITVQNIIDEANVGRSTFYSHFETKEDLLRALCEDLFSHIFYDNWQRDCNFDVTEHKSKQDMAITHMLYHIRDNKKNLINIVNCEQGEIFLRYFREFLNNTMVKEYMEPIDDNSFSVPKEFLINHISSSFINMVYWWAQSDWRYSPEEMTIFFTKMINPIFYRVYIK